MPFNDYLAHHGILGQKWGVRRYQNPDGSYTDAGKRRYFSYDVESAKKKYDQLKRARSLNPYSTKILRDFKYAKRELENEKIKAKLNGKKITNSQIKSEQKYSKNGMSAEDAAITAYKKRRIKKILLAVGGTTVVAAAAYVAYKHFNKTVDKKILKDVVLSRISTDGTNKVHEGFYASYNKKDMARYKGLFGGNMKKLTGKPIYQKKISLKDSLNVASQNSSKKAAAEVLKDSRYKNALSEYLQISSKVPVYNTKQQKLISKAIKSLNNNKIDDNVYKAFNFSLSGNAYTNNSPVHSSMKKSFFDTLKKQGYDAIEDVNDRAYSGFNAKSAHIIFNTNKIDDVVSKEIPVSDLDNLFKKEKSKVVRELVAKTLGKPILASASGTTALGIGAKQSDYLLDMKFINNYRQEHPNTKLTNNQILKIKDKK